MVNVHFMEWVLYVLLLSKIAYLARVSETDI